MSNEFLLNQLEGELQERRDTKKILLFFYIIVTIFILFNFSYLSLEENKYLEMFSYGFDLFLFIVFAMYDTNKINKKYDNIINDAIKNQSTQSIQEKVFNTNSSYISGNTITTKSNTSSYENEDYTVKTSTRRNYIELDDGDGGTYDAYVSDSEYDYHKSTN